LWVQPMLLSPRTPSRPNQVTRLLVAAGSRLPTRLLLRVPPHRWLPTVDPWPPRCYQGVLLTILLGWLARQGARLPPPKRPTTAAPWSLRSSWGTPHLGPPGMSPLTRPWVLPIGRLPRPRMCSTGSGAIVDERRHLLQWASMLKERTTAEARQQHLDMRKEMLNRLQTAINSRDHDSQRMLAEAKELYTSAEARANGTIRQAEQLVVRVRAIELEQKLQEREALNDLKLECELACLATRESSLESYEDALTAEQRDLEDTCASVLARELAADAREGALETRATKVADRERLLAEQQMQELAAAQKRLEDLQAVRVGEAQKVWDFLG
jgi:hypothetical protein